MYTRWSSRQLWRRLPSLRAYGRELGRLHLWRHPHTVSGCQWISCLLLLRNSMFLVVGACLARGVQENWIAVGEGLQFFFAYSALLDRGNALTRQSTELLPNFTHFLVASFGVSLWWPVPSSTRVSSDRAGRSLLPKRCFRNWYGLNRCTKPTMSHA